MHTAYLCSHTPLPRPQLASYHPFSQTQFYELTKGPDADGWNNRTNTGVNRCSNINQVSVWTVAVVRLRRLAKLRPPMAPVHRRQHLRALREFLHSFLQCQCNTHS